MEYLNQIHELLYKLKTYSLVTQDFSDANALLIDLTLMQFKSNKELEQKMYLRSEMENAIDMLIATERSDATGSLIFNTDKLRQTERNLRLKNSIEYKNLILEIEKLYSEIETTENDMIILKIIIDTMKVLL